MEMMMRINDNRNQMKNKENVIRMVRIKRNKKTK